MKSFGCRKNLYLNKTKLNVQYIANRRVSFAASDEIQIPYSAELMRNLPPAVRKKAVYKTPKVKCFIYA